MANVITHPTRIQKSRDVLIKIGAVSGVNRPSVEYKDGTNKTELYRLNSSKLSMYEFQGATTSNFQISDDETTYRFVGDSGWSDGVITNSRVQMSVTAYFLKNMSWVGSEQQPTYVNKPGTFDEGHSIVSQFKNNKDFEAWIEIYKLIDAIEGGVYVYDVAAFAGTLMNYQESYPADGLVECSFDVMSRGEAYMGLGEFINPVRTGLPNRVILPSLPTFDDGGALLRQVKAEVLVGSTTTVIPNSGGLSGVATAQTNGLVFSYENGAATPAALTNVVAGDGTVTKPRARIVKVADKSFVPAAVTVDATNAQVVVTPSSTLESGAAYYAVVEDGALLQKVDAAGVSSSSGEAKPLAGLKTGIFTTA